MTKRPTLQNLKKPIKYISCSRKRIIKAAKFHSQNFDGLARYIIEKAIPNNNYLVRKIGTTKTQVLHWMRMRHFTPRQPPADIIVKPHEYRSDPEVSLNHDDLHARAWEYDFEQPIFDVAKDNEAPPNQREFPVQSDSSREELRNIPGIPHV